MFGSEFIAKKPKTQTLKKSCSNISCNFDPDVAESYLGVKGKISEKGTLFFTNHLIQNYHFVLRPFLVQISS